MLFSLLHLAATLRHLSNVAIHIWRLPFAMLPNHWLALTHQQTYTSRMTRLDFSGISPAMSWCHRGKQMGQFFFLMVAPLAFKSASNAFSCFSCNGMMSKARKLC